MLISRNVLKFGNNYWGFAQRQAHARRRAARARSRPVARKLMHQTALIGNDYSSLCKLKCNKSISLCWAEQTWWTATHSRPAQLSTCTSVRECDPARTCDRLIAFLGIFSRDAIHQNRVTSGTREPFLDEGGKISIPSAADAGNICLAAPHLVDAWSSLGV